MLKYLALLTLSFSATAAFAQQPKTELYDLVKKFLYDSTGYENAGDWAVGQPKKYPVAWKADKIEMSDDTSVNFFRTGTADIAVNGRSFTTAGGPGKWSVMLKGARSGYSSFSLLSPAGKGWPPAYTIDSLFGKRPFKARLLKSCDSRGVAGYHYYEMKLPKKDLAYFKLSWVSLNGSTAIRIDCYDSWSRYAVKLNCPQ